MRLWLKWIEPVFGSGDLRFKSLQVHQNRNVLIYLSNYWMSFHVRTSFVQNIDIEIYVL
jgi:hypothetical protein